MPLCFSGSGEGSRSRPEAAAERAYKGGTERVRTVDKLRYYADPEFASSFDPA